MELNIITLVGGMALFLYGILMTRDGIQHFAGERFKTIITSITSSRFKGLAAGGILTVVLQSSTALTVMLVGLAHSGMVTLAQSMPILLGADIGTTLTVQLIAFRLERFALLIVTTGVLILLFGKKQKIRFIGTFILGFGLVFFGMKLMVDAMAPLKDVQTFSHMINFMGDRPIVSLLASMLFTAIVHSSAATIGLILSLSIAGTMTLDAAVPMVLGANIGTCFTAMLAGIGAGAAGKRIAVSHVFWKVLGVAVVYPFMGPFISLVRLTSGDVARQVANAHTIFNVGMAFIFMPFTGPAVSIVSRLFKAEEGRERPFGPIFLDPAGLRSPALALSYVKRELVRMIGIFQGMLDRTQLVFINRDIDLAIELQTEDEKINILEKEIKFYLARMDKSTLSHDQAHRELQFVSAAGDIESIGDILSKSMLPSAMNYIRKGLKFSEEGIEEITAYHKDVSRCCDMALAAYESGDQQLATQAIHLREELDERETELKQAHLLRLHEGMKESFETSSIHLECLSNLRRINWIMSRFACQVARCEDDTDRLERTVFTA